MHLFSRYLSVSLTCTALAVMIGCASQQVANTENIQKTVTKTAEKRALTPAEAIEQAESQLQIAETENLAFFSPLHLDQARNALESARALSTKPNSARPNGVIEDALAAKTYVNQGLKNKKDVLLYLKEAITHKRMLQKLGVPEQFPEDYKEVLGRFATLIKLIEQGEADEALNRQKPLRMSMTELEINALLNIHLSDAEKVFQEVESLDGERYAPFSYYNAQHKIESSTNYTRTNFRDRRGVERNGIQSLNLAKQALEVTIESKRIMDMDSAKTEQYVLAQQKKYHTLINRLGETQLPPRSLELDYQALEKSVNNRLESHQTLTNQIAALKKELKRYTDIETAGFSEEPLSEVKIVEVMSDKDLGDEPSLTADEQGFDNIEFVE